LLAAVAVVERMAPLQRIMLAVVEVPEDSELPPVFRLLLELLMWLRLALVDLAVLVVLLERLVLELAG
jgi:hypothetical protein